MEFVSTITKESVRLKGLLYRTKSDKCCVFIPGFAGRAICAIHELILCVIYCSLAKESRCS